MTLRIAGFGTFAPGYELFVRRGGVFV
jgi:hypothetical protein